MVSWAVWYIQAILDLASADAKDLLVPLLAEPEFEMDAAWGLFQIARTDRPSQLVWTRNWPMRNKDFSLVWKSSAGGVETSFAESLRAEFAAVLRRHIEGLLAERLNTENPNDFDSRLKQLAVVLAEIDGRASSPLVLDILNMPETGTWLYGGWSRIHALEALLINGVVLPLSVTRIILDPVIAHARAHRYHSEQSSLFAHALCLVIFTDDPSSAIADLGQLLPDSPLSIEGFRQLTNALGYSRCNDAIGLLRELAETKARAEYLGDAWLDAVARFDTEEAHNLLLGFVDPSLPNVPLELIARCDGKLVTRLAEMARQCVDVQTRLFGLVKCDLSAAQASLLGRVLADLGSTDAILCELELLNDKATDALSFELIKNAFVENRPYQGSTSTFTLVPRSSNAIRSKLLDMVNNDPKRRKSAYELLSQIELWRMQDGRPDGEPRNPDLAEGIMWPPEPPI